MKLSKKIHRLAQDLVVIALALFVIGLFGLMGIDWERELRKFSC